MDLEGLQAKLEPRAVAAEPLSRHTTFGIGGPADLFVVAHSRGELADCSRLACEYDVPCLTVGRGANLLVADRGVRGLVVQNAVMGIEISLAQHVDGRGARYLAIVADSGSLLREVSRQAMARGLTGLEWAVDVPGTLGGAIVGNAGAFGGYTSDSLSRALIFEPDRGERWWSREALAMEYRTSYFKQHKRPLACGPVILAAELYLQPGPSAAQMQARAAQYTHSRRETQPSGLSAGSVFKRAAEAPAGFLIENAGLKGERIGDALVSPKHANFIVNMGNATAQDVRQLIERVRERVFQHSSVMLELEIEMVGEW